MPYDPNALTEEQRSYFAKWIWVGALASSAQLALYLSGLLTSPNPLFLGASIGAPIAMLFPQRIDEYVASLLDAGARWAVGFVGIYLFAIFLLRISDLAWSLGYSISGNDAEAHVVWSGLPALLNDGMFVGMAAVFIFHAGYAFAWLRNRKA